jgi:hypothetical protein
MELEGLKPGASLSRISPGISADEDRSRPSIGRRLTGRLRSLWPSGRARRRLRRGIGLMTSPARILPDFILIGAAKCGTTSLYNYLSQHPMVHTPSIKETDFFNKKYQRGELYYRSFYPTLFERAYRRKVLGDAFVTGEASPYYLIYPYAAQRVHHVVPNARLLVLLRDPVARAYSQYHHEVRAGRETLSFAEALSCEDERLDEEWRRLQTDPSYPAFSLEHYSYLARGRYALQLENWMQYFPKEQFLILASEEFYADTASVYLRVLEWLGLPPWEPKRYQRFKDGGNYPPMEESTRHRLIEYFAPHNQRLYELLGKDFGWNDQKAVGADS